MSVRMISTRMVGRERELAELEAALREAEAGRPAFAFVAGDSGVGKSRLVSEFARRARAGEPVAARVLSGDCVDLGSAELPYAPILSVLRPLVRAGDPVLSKLGPHHSSALARLVPALALAIPNDGAPDDDAAPQPRLFEALLALFTAVSEESPLLLILEDLHWADRSTRDLVTFLGRTLCAERVLVVATYRSDELHRRHPLRRVLAELAREPRARRIELGPLAPEDLDRQLADILGRVPERALVERLWRRTGGNPLFTEELLAAGTDGRGPAPRTLRDALMLRFERLEAPAQGVVRLLAAGQRVDHALLEGAGGLEPSLLHEALREAVAGHILVADPDGSYAFRHALLREVIADDLLPGERAALHRRLAAALEERIATGGALGNDLAAAAAHHHAAGDRSAALSASVRAAEAARRVHAYGEELALLERALEHWPSVPDAAERSGTDHPGLLARAAAAADLDGEAARTESLAAAALELLDADAEPHRCAALHVRLARAQRRLGRAGKGLETISRGLELLPEGDTSPERARLLSLRAKVRMLQGRYRDGVEAAHEGLTAARAARDREAEGSALNALGVCLAATGETEAGTEMLREALAIAATDRGEQHDAFTNLADVLFLAGRDREAREVALAGLGQARISRRSADWLATVVAELAIESGDWDEAERRLPARTTEGNGQINLGLRRAHLALGRGDAQRAREVLDAIAGIVEESGEPQFHGPYGVLVAELERRSGDLEGARATIDTALDRIEFCTEDVLRVAMVAAAGVGVEADAAQRARDVGDEAELAWATERLQGLLSRVEAAAVAGARAEAARATGPPARAAQAADVAARAWEALARPYPAAISRWREAEALLMAGDRPGAATAAAAAREIAIRLGAGWLRDEIDGLISRARLATGEPVAGAPPEVPPEDEELPFGLTARELQVLRLVAGGATNREVGAKLFMAEKTASVHVSRILAKLGVRSRTEAAAVAHRQGLGPAAVDAA